MAYVKRSRSTRSNTRNRRTSSRRVVRRAVRKAKNRIFRSRVERVIQSSAEIKTCSQITEKFPVVFQGGNTLITANMWILSPTGGTTQSNYGGINIGQGTADGQRVGNKVRLRKAIFTMTIVPQPWDTDINNPIYPQIVRLYFFKKKLNGSTSPTATELNGAAGNFFQNGTGNRGFQGNLQDYTMLMNTDNYQYLASKTYKIGYAEYNGSGTNTQPARQYYNNNDYQLSVVRRFNVTKYLPKILRWDDQNQNLNNFVFCLLQTVAADGTQMALQQYPLKVNTQTIYHYSDL